MMSVRPIVARSDSSAVDAESLMRTARISHLPVIDGARLVGLWLAREDGPPVLVGSERVHVTGPDSDAAEAMRALVGGAEAVLVWDSGVPAGLLTRSDVMVVLRSAIRRGIGRRHPPPLVARICGLRGADGAGLIVRTIGALGRLDVGFLPKDPSVAPGPLERRLGDVSDAQVVLVEEAEAPSAGRHALGAELRVLVVPASELGALAPERLAAADALLVTSSGEAAEADLEAGFDEIRGGSQLPVFVVGDGPDDEGLAAWARWIESRALRRRA